MPSAMAVADAGLADEAGVVFLAAAQDLDGAVDLAVTADDAVGLAVTGFLGQVFAVGAQELAAGRLLFFAGHRDLALAVLALRAEPERERRRAAGHEILLPGFVGRVVPGGGQRAGLGGFLQEGAHAFLHIFKVLVGHAELFHQVVHRLDMQRPRAGQAVALLLGFAVFHALDKDDGRALFAAYTKHTFSPLYEKSCAKRGRAAAQENRFAFVFLYCRR